MHLLLTGRPLSPPSSHPPCLTLRASLNTSGKLFLPSGVLSTSPSTWYSVVSTPYVVRGWNQYFIILPAFVSFCEIFFGAPHAFTCCGYLLPPGGFSSSHSLVPYDRFTLFNQCISWIALTHRVIWLEIWRTVTPTIHFVEHESGACEYFQNQENGMGVEGKQCVSWTNFLS